MAARPRSAGSPSDRSPSGRSRSDRSLIVGSTIGLLVAGLLIFVTVDASVQDELFDSNSPNAVTPGPPSSFDIR